MTDGAAERDLLYCSECSREVGEQLYATAPRADVWLLLEYEGAWGSKALPESDLAAAVKARLDGVLSATPNRKFCFIRQRRQVDKPGHAFFVALARPENPRLYEFRLDQYGDLLALDIEAVIRGDAAFEPHVRREPLFAACVNGKRDIACAKYGLPIYHQFHRRAGEAAWQCTHLGGHRFAATCAVLPYGACYGRVDADEVGEIVEASRRGEMVVRKTRGLSYYDAPVQAADYYLRGVTGIAAIDGLRLLGIEQTGEEQWTARFEAVSEGKPYEVRLVRQLSEWKVYESSGDSEPKPMPQFALVGYE